MCGQQLKKIMLEVLAEEYQSGRSVRGLSKRETQVVQSIARGKSNKEIAVALSLSVKTIETYRTRIMLKLDAHSVNDLFRFAVRHGLIEI